MRHRVVVTGMGVVSPIGSDSVAFAEALLSGDSGAGPITLFDPGTFETRIACEVKADPGRVLRDRKFGFGMAAAREAMAQATGCGTQPGGDARGSGAGLSAGVGLEVFHLGDMLRRRDPAFESPTARRERLDFLQVPGDIVLHEITRTFGLGCSPVMHISACAAGADGIGFAYRQITRGQRTWMIAGGVDSMINPLGVGGFCKLRAMTRRNDTPKEACRPFDRTRDGFILGEGAAFLVLERRVDALARGATIRAEVLGYGQSFDAHGITEPHPEGQGAILATERALADARLKPEAVDAVNTHGTGTPKNDVVETKAIRAILGDRAERVPAYAMKSMTGHLTAASGALEAAGAIVAMEAGRVPPTLNLGEPDPSCALRIPTAPLQHTQRVVLSNSFGFGGQNTVLVLGRGDTP